MLRTLILSFIITMALGMAGTATIVGANDEIPNAPAVEPMTDQEAMEFVRSLRPTPPPRKGVLPEGFMLTLNAPGCEPGEECDDVGPLYSIRNAYKRLSGQNLYHYGINWSGTEPKAPVNGKHTYDFSGVVVDDFTLSHEYIICHLGHFGGWAADLQFKDTDQYNAYLEKWAEAAARFARETYGTTLFECGGNERDLIAESTFAPHFPNWYEYYMSPVKAIYKGIKKAHPENKLIIGNFCYTTRAHISCIWLADGGDSFDILAVHPYGPRGANVDLEQIVEAKAELTARGRPDVPIILTEGWSTLPLPPSLEGDPAWRGGSREYTEAEIEHYRQAVLDGWRNLTTPKPGYYDPSWVKGASFFVLNDHWGGRYWEPRAKAEYDEQGNLKGFHLDGYFIGTSDPNFIKPLLRPWGLIDIDGKPKGDTVFALPPYIPKHTFIAEMEGQDSLPHKPWWSGGEAWTAPEVVAGKPYRVTVTFTNEDTVTMRNCTWAVGDKTEKDYPDGYAFAFVQGQLHTNRAPSDEHLVKSKLLSGDLPTEVAPGQTVTMEWEIVFDASLDSKDGGGHRKRIRPIADMWYLRHGRPYHTDAWLPRVVVTSQAQ